MKSKFNQVYKESYRSLFEEEAPLPDVDTEGPSPEETAIPKDVPDAPKTQPEQPPVDEEPSLENDVNQLPDPKEAETVSVNLLNNFIDFINLPDEARENFIKEYNLTDNRANSENYKEIIDALKAITMSDFPDRSI